MRRALLILGALGLLIPASAWAVDGEGCNVDTTQFTPGKSGTVRAIWCVTLIDDETTAASGGSPVNYDLTDLGLPDQVHFLVGSDEDCAAGDVSFTTAQTPGGASDALRIPNPVLDLSRANLTKIIVDNTDGAIGTYVTAAWQNVAGCTGGFDVLMIGYEVER